MRLETTAMIHRHERFYFSDGNLRLQVDNTEYLVHGYLFETHARNFIPTLSELRADYISAAPSLGPSILKGIKRTDFDRLLSCLYPRELLIEEARSSEEWISILELASKWEFQSLCRRAINELDSLATPIEKVILSRKYDIPELRLRGYVDLCQSTIPLTEEDGERLGLQDVIKIYRVRQELGGQGAKFSISSEDILEKVGANFPPIARHPATSPSHSDHPDPLHSQTPYIRSPSPPMPRWSLVDLTDSQTGEWTITPSDKSSEYVDALSRVLSPVTVVEVPPVTPLQMPQPARPIMFVPAQKPDWAIEPLPVAMGPSGRAVEKAPSSAFPRLNANSSTSVPGISASKKVTLRNADRTEIDLERLKSGFAPLASTTATARQNLPVIPIRKLGTARTETVEQRQKRIEAEEQKRKASKVKVEEKARKEEEKLKRDEEERKKKEVSAQKPDCAAVPLPFLTMATGPSANALKKPPNPPGMGKKARRRALLAAMNEWKSADNGTR